MRFGTQETSIGWGQDPIREEAIFGGCSAHWKHWESLLWSLCGVRSKRAHSVLDYGTTCNVTFRQSSLTSFDFRGSHISDKVIGSRVWRTDGRTDGRTNGRQIDLTSNSALAYNTAQQRRNVQWKHTHLFSYEIISIFYWKLQQELSIASGRIKKILAPYGTDGRLFTTDVSANFKVTWHKN